MILHWRAEDGQLDVKKVAACVIMTFFSLKISFGWIISEVYGVPEGQNKATCEETQYVTVF